MSRCLESPVEFLSAHQGKEGKEHMSPDGVIALMEYGTRII